MSKRERISPVDTAWLRMDRPNNLMMIVGIMMFDEPMDYARLRRTLEARLLPYRRFRQKVVHDATGAWWEDDEDFDLDGHLHHAALVDAVLGPRAGEVLRASDLDRRDT